MKRNPVKRTPRGRSRRPTPARSYARGRSFRRDLAAHKRAARECEWFAGCTSPATGTTPHPILGSVPTCDRHHAFATGVKRNPAGGIRIVHNKLLGGWYVVRGPHQTPLNGRFGSKAEAQAWLAERGIKRNPGGKRRARIGEATPAGTMREWIVRLHATARQAEKARNVTAPSALHAARKVFGKSWHIPSLQHHPDNSWSGVAQSAARIVRFGVYPALRSNPSIKYRGTRGPVDEPYRRKYRALSRATRKSFRRGAAGAENSPFFVQVKRGPMWITLARFSSKDAAAEYGKMLAARYTKKSFRVFWK